MVGGEQIEIGDAAAEIGEMVGDQQEPSRSETRGDHDDGGRHQPAGAPFEKAPVGETAVRGFAQDQQRDQITGNDEEDVDPDEAAAERGDAGMEQKYRQNRYRAQAIDIRPVRCPPVTSRRSQSPTPRRGTPRGSGLAQKNVAVDSGQGPPNAVVMNFGEEFGGCDRDRTCDPLIKSQLLYQLSYAPTPRHRGWRAYSHTLPACPAIHSLFQPRPARPLPPAMPDGVEAPPDAGRAFPEFRHDRGGKLSG